MKSIDDQAFRFRETKDDRVLISWYGRQVKILTVSSASRFLQRVRVATPQEQQRQMARITGNFKRGNERPPNT